MMVTTSYSDDLLKETLENAWQYVLKYDIANAMALAKTASTIAPDSPDVAHLLGILASRDGRSDIALPLLQKALDAGVTERRLRDMTEALMIASQPQAALAPITDAIKHFGENSANLGMLAAVQIALEDFDAGAKSAHKAVQMADGKVLWEGSLAFCDLILQKFDTGLKVLTARPTNLVNQARCPVFYKMVPTDLWLKNEQGPGDTIFFLCHAKKLKELGWRLHVQSHTATLELLKNSGLFASVSLSFNCPSDGLWIAIGDLPLAAMQIGLNPLNAPLQLQSNPKLQAKLKKIIAKFGPAPYIAVTWRGGVQGNKQRAGVRMGDRYIDTTQLGKMLSNINATVISLQRVPDKKEANAFKAALGRDYLDLSRLNNNLEEMLALLSLVDEYIAVPNTNHHLREALSLPTHAIVNRPYEDWRWCNAGNSPWYPQATVYRQPLNGDLTQVFADIFTALSKKYQVISSKPITGQNVHESATTSAPAPIVDINTLSEGWAALYNNNVTLAIKTAQNALALSPDNPDALHLLGWSAMRDLKIDIAVSVLARAVELAPLEGRIIGDYIRALSAANQLTKALEVASDAINNELTQNKSGLYYGRATVYMQLNRLHECLADYDSTMKIASNRLDAPEYAGLVRLKIGDARQGFRNLTARKVARREELLNDWCCPRLKPEHKGTRVLIKRDMGLGDELTYLRYLPWLTEAGMVVDYWAGNKLAPILERMGYCHKVYSDAKAAPNRENYDLSFIVNDLPVAVDLLDAPAIAPPLLLTPRPDYVEKWQAWLNACGQGPYIGFNWRAGAAATGVAEIHSKLAKAIDATAFAEALSPIKATWISLQRNVMLHDIQAFEQQLGAPVHDAAAMTDDLEDLLALLYVLDENIGVSNTNMHLRASLGKGSRVMVQSPGGDWRWGYEGNQSLWFTESKVYRQTIEGDWQPALEVLTQDLSNQYGLKAHHMQTPKAETALSSAQTSRVIWLTAGVIKQQNGYKTSDLASARYRVLAPAAALEKMGWESEFVNEQNATLVGGWGSAVPKAGDTVIISKVFTDFGLQLAKDAKARGAHVIVDFCDNFLNHSQRGALQQNLISIADKIIASTDVIAKAISATGKPVAMVISDPVEMQKQAIKFSPKKTLRLVWFGHANNIDTLARFLPELSQYADKQKLSLNVVTTLPNGAEDLAKITPSHLSVEYTPWSAASTQKAIADCDIVVIPTLDSDIKNAKSPNRLLEPLWCGRFVVAGPHPAYTPFAKYAWVSSNLIEGIDWAINNASEVKARVQLAQDEISANFSIDIISQKWHTIFNSPADQDIKTVMLEQVTSDECIENTDATKSLINNPWFDSGWYQNHYGLDNEEIATQHFLTQNQLIDASPIFQSTEVARFLKIDNTQKAHDVLTKFSTIYPVNKDFIQPKSIAVFTAIFGGYDLPPEVEKPDPKIDYILFTDEPIDNLPSPWQLRLMPRIFDDPQVDARRIKVLSHLFLPDYQASVWIDGNVKLKSLSADYVLRILSTGEIAVCRHQFRSCIYDEAVQILKTGKDAPAPVMKQIRYYESLTYPKQFGLHATMFMVRDHRSAMVKKYNSRWWEILSEHSKRDQLSFDFVRWELSAPVLSMPINCRDNNLFQWGNDVSRGHKGQIRRSDESIGRAFNQSKLNEQDKNHLNYRASFDRWPRSFLLQLFDLNVNLAQCHQAIPESVLYFKETQNTPLSIPDPRKGNEQELYLAAITESKRILFIGHQSHNILAALNFSSAQCAQALFDEDELSNISNNWFKKVHPSRYLSYVGAVEKIDLASFDTFVLDDSDFDNQAVMSVIKPLATQGARLIFLTKKSMDNENKLDVFRGISNESVRAFVLN
jgi:tetratricopeptide (TPR) repeat protein